MDSENLPFATIVDVSRMIRSGEIASVALTELMLARIAAHDGVLNAFVTVTADGALEQAAKADREIAEGMDRGLLHGIPIAIKDLFDTRGVRTTSGMKLHEDRVPDEDATVVERLSRAGAVMLGKTNMHELAFGATSINPFYGPVGNPWRPDHHPGGSSGGSAAAVAAGMAYAAIGTETGCSVRQPAACCGIVGHKPSFGLVSKAGVTPIVWTMDHVGPLTRSVTDAAIMLHVMAGPDARDPYSAGVGDEEYLSGITQSIEGKVIGVPRAYYFEEGDPAVVAIVEQALATFTSLGAKLVEVDIPDVKAAYHAAGTTILSEAASLWAGDAADHADQFSDEVRGNIEKGMEISAADYVSAQQFRRDFSTMMDGVFDDCDVLAMPTSNITASPIDNTPESLDYFTWRNTATTCFTGEPGISVPCGFTDAGLPVGLMINGRMFDDATVLQVAQAFEQATEWHDRHPVLQAAL